jgi:hypothetical protein
MTEGAEDFQTGPRWADRTLSTPATGHGHLELTMVADGAWRVSDLRVPDEDASHVVAFIEASDESLEVVWLRGSSAALHRFDSMESALDTIDDVLTTGEPRDVSALDRGSAGRQYHA